MKQPNEIKAKILDALRGAEVKFKDLVDVVGKSKTTVRRYLNELIDEGRVRRSSKGTYTAILTSSGDTSSNETVTSETREPSETQPRVKTYGTKG